MISAFHNDCLKKKERCHKCDEELKCSQLPAFWSDVPRPGRQILNSPSRNILAQLAGNSKINFLLAVAEIIAKHSGMKYEICISVFTAVWFLVQLNILGVNFYSQIESLKII